MLAYYLSDLSCVRRRGKLRCRLDAPTASAARPARPIVRDRSHILNPTDPKTLTRQHPDRCLRARTWSPSLVTSRSANADVERSNPFVLRHLRSSRGCLHCSIRCPLETVRLDVLTTSTPRDSLSTSQIGNVNHSIVETGIDVGDPPPIYCLGFLGHIDLSERLPRPKGEFKPFTVLWGWWEK